MADILVTLMNRGCWDMDSVHELLLDTFPNAHHSTDISNWVKLVRAMCAAWRQAHTQICTSQDLKIARKMGHTGIERATKVGFISLSLECICDALIKNINEEEKNANKVFF